MAKLKGELKEVYEKFNALSEQDKITILNKSNVWYLRHKGNIVTPTTELQTLINKIARLSWLCKRYYELEQTRKLTFNLELIQAISEEAIEKNVVEPIREVLNRYIKHIEKLIAESKKDFSPKKGKSADETKEDNTEETK